MNGLANLADMTSESLPPETVPPDTVSPDAPSPDAPSSDSEADDLPEQMRVRRDKRQRMLAAGADPYPVGFARTLSLAALRAAYDELPPDTATGEQVGVTGRIVLSRTGGKLCFATLQESGTQVQVMLSLDRLGADALAAWKADTDLGDHVGVHGEVITSRRGELSVLADRYAITSKALRPLPDKHRGLTDPEARVRQRYVDLVVNPQARRTVEVRAAVTRGLRDTLHRRDFIEVETPMLQPLHGGAAARPFTTHSNAYDLDLYLRISLELYLKRCVVGGLDRVFEINRNFRNEGADNSHSPEFVMLEAYQAYADYDTMATLTRELVQEGALVVGGSHVVTHADGSEHDLGGQWRSITLYGAVSDALGEPVDPAVPLATLRAHAERVGLAVHPSWSAAKLVEELFEHLVAGTLRAPTFVRDFPVETSPLTRAHRSQPGLAEKWDLYIDGVELATAYSELVDPVVQRERLVAQSLLAAGGDPEAMSLDEDFLRAMEHGMPPSGGVGMGVDRLLMALTGLGIRETILFPFVRPE